MARKKQATLRFDTDFNTTKILFNIKGAVRWEEGSVRNVFNRNLPLIVSLKEGGMPIDRTAFAAGIEGIQYGKSFKDFKIEIAGVFWGILPDPLQPFPFIPGSFLIEGEKGEKRVWQKWLRTVSLKDVPAFILERWDQNDGWITIITCTGISMQACANGEAEAQIKKLARGFSLLAREERRGRQPGDEGYTSEGVFENAVKACCELFEENPDADPAKADILKKARITNSTFYAKNLSIRKVKDEARKRIEAARQPAPTLMHLYKTRYQCPDCGETHRCALDKLK